MEELHAALLEAARLEQLTAEGAPARSFSPPPPAVARSATPAALAVACVALALAATVILLAVAVVGHVRWRKRRHHCATLSPAATQPKVAAAAFDGELVLELVCSHVAQTAPRRRWPRIAALINRRWAPTGLAERAAARRRWATPVSRQALRLPPTPHVLGAQQHAVPFVVDVGLQRSGWPGVPR